MIEAMAACSTGSFLWIFAAPIFFHVTRYLWTP